MTAPVIRTALVPASEILGLRREVLRPGLPREAAVFPEDGDPAAFHIASYEGFHEGDAPEVLGCGTFFPEPFPGPFPEPRSGPRPDSAATAYRFRGMASAPAARGRGHGAAVLRAGTAEAAARGAALLWCNGRTTARGFYEHQGFRAHGEEFVVEGVGPHLVFVREIRPRTRRTGDAAARP
ncbi:GNAT family N-acetyltransferase [Streptomyces pini]|uniref:Acetyltransferase (GNAT) family protein n=1 Tax=Streptomyces pini TaxID=1520580 RepID=A0A1I3YLC0_9ACTN|nr:GNAT family N-acetyltransferase [Streptomyces pini]SFK32622.1 Acetyltransferase (GNAT) family protein [Streptomyces pini]